MSGELLRTYFLLGVRDAVMSTGEETYSVVRFLRICFCLSSNGLNGQSLNL